MARGHCHDPSASQAEKGGRAWCSGGVSRCFAVLSPARLEGGGALQAHWIWLKSVSYYHSSFVAMYPSCCIFSCCLVALSSKTMFYWMLRYRRWDELRPLGYRWTCWSAKGMTRTIYMIIVSKKHHGLLLVRVLQIIFMAVHATTMKCLQAIFITAAELHL